MTVLPESGVGRSDHAADDGDALGFSGNLLGSGTVAGDEGAAFDEIERRIAGHGEFRKKNEPGARNFAPARQTE